MVRSNVRMIVIAGVALAAIPLVIALFGAVVSGDGLGDVGGAVLVLGFIALSFVFAGKLARGLLRGATKADVMEKGVAGTAVIESMRETGTTINDNPFPEFELAVTVPGKPPYTAKVEQILPRLMLGQVRPGMTVAVKVMPDDPQTVGIDWNATTGGEAPTGTTVPEGMFEGAPVSNTVDVRDFLARATRAGGEIDQMSETGMTAPSPATGEELEVFAFVVTVNPPAGEPYEAKLLQGVPKSMVGRFGPGAQVPVGVNPDDPDDIAIDWEAYRSGGDQPA